MLLARIPNAGVACGWVFEHYMHSVIPRPNRLESSRNPGSPESLKRSGSSARSEYRASSAKPDFIYYELTLTSKNPIETYEWHKNSPHSLTFLPRDGCSAKVYDSPEDFISQPPECGIYYFPSTSNNPSFDSFMLCEDCVYIFQMTVASSHRIDSRQKKGIPLLEKIIPKGLQWHYILVMPNVPVNRVKTTSVIPEWRKTFDSVHVMIADFELTSPDPYIYFS